MLLQADFGRRNEIREKEGPRLCIAVERMATLEKWLGGLARSAPLMYT